MSEIGLLQTALLLGFYVALAGSYGLVYAIARLQDSSILHRISFALYGLHGLAAIAIVTWTPLHVGWKGLIVASSVAFLAIPPITWRFLQRTHETEVQG
jgi:peptidoglycan/LPS O-acetylase OafA/YrhL